MNTSAITAIAISLSKLTLQDQAIAVELAKGLSGRAEAKQPENGNDHWTALHLLRLRQFLKESPTLTRKEKRQGQSQLAQDLGRSEVAIKNMLSKIRLGQK
jgi:hypothetical protein